MVKSNGSKDSYGPPPTTWVIRRPPLEPNGVDVRADADGAGDPTADSAAAPSDGNSIGGSEQRPADASDLAADNGHEAADDGDGSSSRPGARSVAGRAFGQYPAWGRANESSGREGEEASTSATDQLENDVAESSQSIVAFLVDEEDGRAGQVMRNTQDAVVVIAGRALASEGQTAEAFPSVEEPNLSSCGENVIAESLNTVASSTNSQGVPYPVVNGVPLSIEQTSTSTTAIEAKDQEIKYCWPGRFRCIYLLTAIALTALVVSLSVAFAGGGNNDDADSAGQGGASIAIDPPVDAGDIESEESPKPQQIGSPIHGLRNESGAVIYVNPETGIPHLSYGHPSNFSFSGFSLALSKNGRIIIVGEPGTDTVRAFQWDTFRKDWSQMGQTLRSRRYETDCISAGSSDYVHCHISFGFNVALSRDSLTMVVTSSGPGANDGEDMLGPSGQGILSTFQWDAAKSEWAQIATDLAGDARGDGLGVSLKMTPDGRTMVATAGQSLHPDFAMLFGLQGYAGQGYARVFDLVGSTWVQRGQTIRGHNEHDGLVDADISENGQSIAVGTLFGGYVDVYDWDGLSQSWTLRGESIMSPMGEADFGYPTRFSSQDGNRIVVASTYVSSDEITSNANLIYVYEWNGSRWVQLDHMAVMESQSGYVARFNSIGVSSDGIRLVAAFSNGSQMYEWNGERYVQKGEYVEGGRTSILSEDGEVFAVGRPLDNSLGVGMGRTTLYHSIFHDNDHDFF